MYKAIIRFADSKDKNYIYEIGDFYPREGYKPSKERINGLLSGQNGAGKAVIAEDAEEPVIEEEESEIEEEEPVDEEVK